MGCGLSRTRGDRGGIFSTWLEIRDAVLQNGNADSAGSAGIETALLAWFRIEDHDPSQRPFKHFMDKFVHKICFVLKTMIQRNSHSNRIIRHILE